MPKQIIRYYPLIFLTLLGLYKPASVSGQSLLPLDKGLKATPLAMTGFDGALYAVYQKERTQTTKIFTVAKWDGSVWSFLPDITADTSAAVNAMRFYNGILYVGGAIKQLNGSANAGNIVRFAPVKKVWETAGTNMSENSAVVLDMEVYNGQLFAAGKFRILQGQSDTINNIMSFNGQAWHSLKVNGKNGTGTSGVVYDLLAYNDTLAVAGDFSTVNNVKSENIVLLKDSVLHQVSNQFKVVKRLGSYKGRLFCLGTDTSGVTGIFARTSKRMVLAQAGLQALSATYIFAEFDGDLWAAGVFKVNGKLVSLVRWNGTQWQQAVDPPLAAPVLLTVVRAQLFIGGNFEVYNKIILNRIARFDKSLVKVIGRVYFDKDNNCIYNPQNDLPLRGRLIIISPGAIILKTNDDGSFVAILPANTYTVKHIAQKYWQNCGAGEFTVNYQTYKDTVLDFGARPTNDNINDVRVNIVGNTGWKARKGFTENYTVTYENVGTTDITLGNLNLGYNKAISFTGSNTIPSSATAGNINWLYTGLKVGEKRTIDVNFKVPSAVSTDSLTFTANSYMSAADIFTDDNYDTLQQTLSVLPIGGNAKMVFPEPAGTDSVAYIQPDEKEVSYLIKFENTGTDTVRTLYVIDTIDVNLNIQYTQETGASHPYTTQVVNCDPALGKGVLIWTFNNINLPPNPSGSNDFTANRGHIGFKVQFKNIMTPGYAFKNRASIIFDYNTPLKTNFTYCEVKPLVSVEEISTDAALKVYPNPAQAVLFIENDNLQISTLTLIDMTGKTVMTQPAEGHARIQLDVQQLPKGIYCLHAVTNSGVVNRKIVLE